MVRDCTRCGGFGEYMYAVDSSGAAAYTSCPDCDGYGILPADTGQSFKMSSVETLASTAIGFAVSMVLTAIVMPAFGYPTTWAHDFWITLIFTVASVARGIFVRRVFEALR